MRFLVPLFCLLLFLFINDERSFELAKFNPNQYNNKTENMAVQFAYTILYVPDIAATVNFYTEVFGFEQKLLTPEKDYGEVSSGTTTLAFASLELGNSNFEGGFLTNDFEKPPFGIELAFTTDNVEELMERAIDKGGVLLKKSVTKPWGQKVGYIRDLNGFLIEICTPIED